MIRVVNVRGLKGADRRAAVAYVGRRCAGWRGHPLGNPFRPEPPGGMADCLARYREWLQARPTLDADLAALWDECDRGAKPLGCWCVTAVAGDGQEIVCHAQILAAHLAERFASHPG